MKILITGASGFIGSFIVEEALRQGFDTWAAIRRSSSKEYLQEILAKINTQEGPVFLEVKVKKGNRKDLGRPTTTPIQNKEALMDFLKK